MYVPKGKFFKPEKAYKINQPMNGPDYQAFRKAVLKRDRKKCQWPHCSRTRSLEVHHIRPVRDSKHLRFSVFNGITLCQQHHRGIHAREHEFEQFFTSIVRENEERARKLERPE